MVGAGPVCSLLRQCGPVLVGASGRAVVSAAAMGTYGAGMGALPPRLPLSLARPAMRTGGARSMRRSVAGPVPPTARWGVRGAPKGGNARREKNSISDRIFLALRRYVAFTGGRSPNCLLLQAFLTRAVARPVGGARTSYLIITIPSDRHGDC